MKLTDNQERDYKTYFKEEGDPGFSPEFNNAIIERTIKKTDIMRAKKRKEYQEKIGERSDAVATYLKAVDRGKEPNIDKYFGKAFLAHLQGQKILETLHPDSLITKKKIITLGDIRN